MDFCEITPLILTFNEAANIRRTLERLAWAQEVVVLDSFSTDATLKIAQSFPRVRIVQRKFDNHTAQWNFGLDQLRSDWALTLDADYVLSDELVKVFADWSGPKAEVHFARFKYCICGQPLRASLYPPRAVLFRPQRFRYKQDGHTQVLDFDGPEVFLDGFILHDDRKPLDRWLSEQNRYASHEAEKLLDSRRSALSPADRIRKKVIFAPMLVFLYALFAKGLILDGWRGCFYVLQRTLAEMILSMKLIEWKFNGLPESRTHRGD